MTEARAEIGKRLPNQSSTGVDIGQLADNLRLTPAERLSRMVAWTVWIRANRGIARPRTQK